MPLYRVAFAEHRVGATAPVWPRRVAAHDLGGVAEAVLSIAAEVLYDPWLTVRIDWDEDSDVATGAVQSHGFEVARLTVTYVQNAKVPVWLLPRRELREWKEKSA